MYKYMTKSAFTIGLLCILMAVPAFAGSVNKSVKIAAGAESNGASSVNGSVSVGENAIVNGGVQTVNGTVSVDSGATIRDASTVNGSVRLGDRVTAEDLETVNGTIKVGQACVIDGRVETVNGRIVIAEGATVARDVGNVNGQIELSGATIDGDVSTVSGDIYVIDGARVRGNVIIEEPGGWSWGNSKKKRKPEVVIGPGSTVEGVIDIEYEVDLYISETADVGGVRGVMSMDDAIRFSGKRP